MNLKVEVIGIGIIVSIHAIFLSIYRESPITGVTIACFLIGATIARVRSIMESCYSIKSEIVRMQIDLMSMKYDQKRLFLEIDQLKNKATETNDND